MKPGTRVMLVRYSGNPAKGAPPIGACGEVMDPGSYLSEIKFGDVAVNFPHTPSYGSSGWWAVAQANLIKINDPDADISDTLEAPVLTLHLEGIR